MKRAIFENRRRDGDDSSNELITTKFNELVKSEKIAYENYLEFKEQIKNQKKKLLEKMAEKDIWKLENDNLSITRIAENKRQIIDTAKVKQILKDNTPHKTTITKESLRITYSKE